MHPKLVSAALLPLLLVTPVEAAECALANATYVQDHGSFVLQFKPRPADTPTDTTNLFTLTGPVDGKPTEFSGEVIWGSGIAVPAGYLTQECLTERTDVTSCSYWEGVVYAIGGDRAGDLPAETSLAPKGVLLSDLGRTLYSSGLVLDEVPGDYFKLEGCK
jgi:hypothetical protein